MVGCYLGAAICQMPILIDGFISAVSAYLACMLNQTAKEYMIPTHCSAEPAAKMIMEKLEMEHRFMQACIWEKEQVRLWVCL